MTNQQDRVQINLRLTPELLAEIDRRREILAEHGRPTSRNQWFEEMALWVTGTLQAEATKRGLLDPRGQGLVDAWPTFPETIR